MSDIWSNIPTTFTNEADVELRLVLPLLHALAYEAEDIASKYPVEFREGRVGRKPEADFVCFNGPLHNKDTSLLVVEAKKPGEALPDGKAQGESYAANLKAPLLLLTNGEQLEIWQLKATQDSERVFVAPVASLAASQGTIEQLLAKRAVVDYCHTFHVKTIIDASSDFGRYETAELKRTTRYAASIDRTVSPVDTADIVGTTKLLANYPSGCVVVATSGYGKTTPANRLFRQAIEWRWRGGTARLPFDVPIADLEQTGLSIVSFMQQRLCAHVPNVTESVLIDRLRSSGAVIVCDGFDRAAPEFQRRLSTEIINLLRDYPLIQIFVFSREAVRPNVSQPLLTLMPLTEAEKRELEKITLDDGSADTFSVIAMMSPTLSALCDNPLLLKLALEFWKRKQAFPDQLAPLFRSWLDNLLKVEETEAVSFILREKALTLIADATRGGPITTDSTLVLLEANDIPASVLNELVRHDAVRVSGATVEIQHEALADYLRAKKLASISESELLALIPSLPMPAESFFPVLLMAQLSTSRLQSALWKRMTEAGPNVYFDALRYRFDVSQELNKLDPRILSQEYLTELLEGIEQPLNNFFSALREPVIERITSERGSELAVTGIVHAASSSLNYKLHVREARNTPSVNVEAPTPPGILRSVNLNLSHYRLDSARLVAMALLKESVLDAVKFQALKGGPALAQDRLLGRCRYLANEYDLPIALNTSFDALEQALLPHKGKRVHTGALHDGQRFSIQELLDDIAILRATGASGLDPWWARLGWDDTVALQAEDVIRRVLDEQYRRAQIIYAEIVNTTFPAIARDMDFYPSLPIRWNLTVVRRTPPDGGATVYFSWSPVSTWQQAGADVAFDGQAGTAVDVEQTRAELTALDRSSIRLPRFQGFTQLSDFSGRQWNGQFDGTTPAIQDACDLLNNDLESIFSSMPRRDGP